MGRRRGAGAAEGSSGGGGGSAPSGGAGGSSDKPAAARSAGAAEGKSDGLMWLVAIVVGVAASIAALVLGYSPLQAGQATGPALPPAASSSAAGAQARGSASSSSSAAAEPAPPMPERLLPNYECALRCSQLTDGDRAIIERTLRGAGCDPENPGSHVLCSTSPEQVCAGSCGSGKQDMTKFLPGAFGPSSTSVLAEELVQGAQEVHQRHWACSEKCSREGVLIDAGSTDAKAVALATLRRCGVVQLKGGYDLAALDRLQEGIDKLYAKKKSYDKLLDRVQLHDGRFQVYLPFAAPFNDSSAALGAGELVLSVLEGYMGGVAGGFGIDHVTVLTSESPSGNQSLHPDVHYFMGRTVSVHTALVDVTREMGPTFFCPCTGELEDAKDWPASAAVKMTILQRKACFGKSFAPSFTPRGTVTIYDSAMFHMGLENLSGKQRPVLKLEVGAESFPERRNYIQMAPAAGKKQVHRFRAALGPPRMGSSPGSSAGR